MNKPVFLLLLFSVVAVGNGGDPRLPGGRGTTPDHSAQAFSRPFPDLPRDLTRQFFVGNSFFRDAWVEAPSSTVGRDGLGPTFNAVSCSACHSLDGRGEGITAAGGISLSLLFRLSGEDGKAHPVYGDQLNPFGAAGVKGEGSVGLRIEEMPGRFPDGEVYSLRRPFYTLENLNYGGFDGKISPRVANQLPGLGLLEAVPEADIRAGADALDENGDGISGRPQEAFEIATGRHTLGRFGWKAGQPSLRQQNAAAFLGDIGITSSLFPRQNCTDSQVECAGAPGGGEPEATDQILDRLTLYTQLLAVPARRSPDLPSTKRGEEIFTRINCQACHRPSFVTGREVRPELAGQDIFPYTDLLLHDMGEGLSDGRREGEASAKEWRTPPLWGIGLIPRVNGHQNLLHDGRARGVQEAILWHGGEAAAARDAFVNLSREERGALVEFVNSL